MDKKVDILKDADGKSIVVINDLRFKGRWSVDWNVVEGCKYVCKGKFFKHYQGDD